jgi:type IV pilus assembly protein PilA
LAAVAIPAYQDYIAKAQISEAVSIAEGVKSEVAIAFSQDNKCPDNSVDAHATAPRGNIALFSSIQGKFIDSVTTGGSAVASGGCTVTALYRTSGVNNKLSGKKFVYTLVTGSDNITKWNCTTNVETSIRPKTCEAIS